MVNFRRGGVHGEKIAFNGFRCYRRKGLYMRRPGKCRNVLRTVLMIVIRRVVVRNILCVLCLPVKLEKSVIDHSRRLEKGLAEGGVSSKLSRTRAKRIRM